MTLYGRPVTRAVDAMHAENMDIGQDMRQQPSPPLAGGAVSTCMRALRRLCRGGNNFNNSSNYNNNNSNCNHADSGRSYSFNDGDSGHFSNDSFSNSKSNSNNSSNNSNNSSRSGSKPQRSSWLLLPLIFIWVVYTTVVKWVCLIFSPMLRILVTAPVHHPRAIFPIETAMMPRKTLVLDLDETLVHSRHMSAVAGVRHDVINVEMSPEGDTMEFFVHQRPHTRLFLSMVSQWYDVVAFTASIRPYAESVVRILDPDSTVFKACYFRENCLQDRGQFIKNLGLVRSDLSNVLIIDNTPGAYLLHPDNAVPIKTWTDDPHDEELLDLLPFLYSLQYTNDVRSVLGMRLCNTRAC